MEELNVQKRFSGQKQNSLLLYSGCDQPRGLVVRVSDY
jgi:hypothetical protein